MAIIANRLGSLLTDDLLSFTRYDTAARMNQEGKGCLKHTLESFGFSAHTMKLIINCVSRTSFSILWNGERLPSLSPKRGLDPLSPSLFVSAWSNSLCSYQRKS